MEDIINKGRIPVLLLREEIVKSEKLGCLGHCYTAAAGAGVEGGGFMKPGV